MRIKNLLPTLTASALFVVMAVSAFAQVGRIEGDVKKADSNEPIPNAVVEIVRTDMKGNYPLKTDKKGHFVHAGVPFSGRYTLLISAEGFAPDALLDIRPTGEALVVKLSPGDGRKLTIDEVKSKSSPKPSAGGGGNAAAAAPVANAKNEAEAKKARDEVNKKNEEIRKQNEKNKESFNALKEHFDAGRALADKKDFNGAVTEFTEAVKYKEALTDASPVFANLALALYNRGITNLNASASDPSKKEAAKADLLEAIKQSEQAMSLSEAAAAGDATKANTPEAKASKAQFVKIKADSESLLGKRWFDGAQADAANKDYVALAAMTDKPEDKKLYVFKGADTLREAGKSEEAIAAFQNILQSDASNLDALYGMGLAYAGAGKFQESANTLQQFVDKAPATDKRVDEVKAVIKDLVVGNNLQPPKAIGGGGTKKKKQ